MGEERYACRLLVGKPEGGGPLGKPRCRWKCNIKLEVKGVSWEGMDWINLAQDRDKW
jgi:hypothetical protein